MRKPAGSFFMVAGFLQFFLASGNALLYKEGIVSSFWSSGVLPARKTFVLTR
jgi:hypothetical protein